MAQFICGFHDIDLRDTVGLGHGRLLAHHTAGYSRSRWLTRLAKGELAGIAITEPHGGSRPAEPRTCAARQPDGTWQVNGRKTWISRLVEASVFIVFFRDPMATWPPPQSTETHPDYTRNPWNPAASQDGPGESLTSTPSSSIPSSV
ncbi:acyl-CoA dehydrogenase family protein [Kibdelosporangium aridum]|uniref:acyl-CoA dehydrogenase family protein n=1 Tax=Kibdelosporangium aridum TaxID=2030 RepID=UPI001F2709D8|nr:acyl-CoA dehydrogenase family protein [Kibdelosporangium aridum]